LRASELRRQVAAPERLVVGGVYRYVRNPMYVAVLVSIVGQALLLGQLVLLLYAGAAWLAVAAFVRFYEEPTLTLRFGADYGTYRRGVRLVASPSSLETQRARRTRVEVMRSQATLGGSRSLIESGVSSCKIDSVATPCALVLRSRDCLRCSKIFSTALVETLRTRSRTSL
jgi:hypothetical protein